LYQPFFDSTKVRTGIRRVKDKNFHLLIRFECRLFLNISGKICFFRFVIRKNANISALILICLKGVCVDLLNK